VRKKGGSEPIAGRDRFKTIRVGGGGGENLSRRGQKPTGRGRSQGCRSRIAAARRANEQTGRGYPETTTKKGGEILDLT